jgi:hypothetical protein
MYNKLLGLLHGASEAAGKKGQVLEEVTSYIAISLGKDDPITKNFLKEINEKKKVVQTMVRCEIHCNTLDQK